VRALRLAGTEPVGRGSRRLFEVAGSRLNPDTGDRALHPDIEEARRLVEAWAAEEVVA
jgi:hypothetical protein